MLSFLHSLSCDLQPVIQGIFRISRNITIVINLLFHNITLLTSLAITGSVDCSTNHSLRKAISRLHEDKSDGDGELWSNHVIYPPKSLSIHISMFLTGVITHGYNPIYFLTETLVSLPKDTGENICDSDNCRGIYLCSSITKHLKWCMMLTYCDKLATLGLQFSFKSGHSTTMCSLVTKEVVTYYWNRHSRVYAAFIDASKAFERIRYDRLFGILIKRSYHL